jgi:hypothetical protein
MLALPFEAPLTSPPDVTVATLVLELDHVTFEAGEPSALVATACTLVPDAIVLVARVTVRKAGGAVVEEPDPPHADTPSDNAARIVNRIEATRYSESWGLHHRRMFPTTQ